MNAHDVDTLARGLARLVVVLAFAAAIGAAVWTVASLVALWKLFW